MTKTIDSVLSELRAASSSARELGDRFERLMRGYLATDPLYAERFESVWLWQDWRGREGEPDTGIDLVAAERDGGVCAIQCKFYDPSHRLEKSDIDSFFTASGKSPFTSRLIISTTDHWSVHAEKALDKQQIPVTRLRVRDLAASPVDWSTFSPARPGEIRLRETKSLHPHQEEALTAVLGGLREADRGKLIMACGTGKTLTSLRIAEAFARQGGQEASASILLLVPSISLLSQTVREWTAEAEAEMRAFAVCSDTKVGRHSEDISRHDLAFNATTDAKKLLAQFSAADTSGNPASELSVIFSTYQSLAVIHEAQGLGLPSFDLIICDEAHRTTGATLAGEEESHFVRIHDGDYIGADKRLYMTATPRLFDDSTKSRAKERDALLCSMDDETLFGSELHRLGFGEAVERGLLTDYRVLVLAVEEKYVAKTFQRQLADANSELNLDDAVKIAGCWNGLIGRGEDAIGGDQVSNGPMQRAVAFSRSIKDSKRITALFEEVTSQLVQADDPEPGRCVAHHVDGTFNALRRNAELDWLRSPFDGDSRTCRILSNARCLSEGVDVPGLDAVLFLNPRHSVVDVVQSVGRVMRKSKGKEYGYIILPVGVPADVAPEEALRDNKKYKVVWQTLQALRAHDDRFNATINKIDLSKSRPDAISVIGMPGGGGEADGSGQQLGLAFPVEEWRDAIYAKIVEKCGDRLYWESWAADIAEIAERHSTRIRALLDDPSSRAGKAFARFLAELQTDINPALDVDDAVEMLSQHLITKPVFDALFDGYDFARLNPVSQTMQRVLDAIGDQGLGQERESLEQFYESVRMRASGIDSDEGRQRIITELYEKFFRNAFPKLADRLGIVYTPIEVVDFMVGSVEAILRSHFDCSIGNQDVHVLDPFAGTGTFLVRMLQSEFMQPANVEQSFTNELHANEIVLLAYYIAAINIESAFHQRHGGEYRPFPGIVLTDTFQLAEKPIEIEGLERRKNHDRVVEQQEREIRVVIGNPPYSVGQTSQNDANQNLKYPAVDGRIDATYASRSNATLRRNLYDSYVRALRWASDRIGTRGVVAFVTNGYFIDGRSFDGLRKSLIDEFDTVYCLNLRGNQRGVQGELSRREGGKIFGSGSRAPVAITLLIKDGTRAANATLRYFDVGGYLTREEKLERLRSLEDIRSVPWEEIEPSPEGDWIDQVDSAYLKLLPLASKDEASKRSVFVGAGPGLSTGRDPWVYNFDRGSLEANVARTIDSFNEEAARIEPELAGLSAAEAKVLVEQSLNTDSSRISWSRALKGRLARQKGPIRLAPDHIAVGSYRPFCKQWVYFDPVLNEASSGQTRYFPHDGAENLAIVTTGPGARREFSALMVDTVPNLHFQDSGQTFARYRYELDGDAGTLLEHAEASTGRASNISPEALRAFQTHYGDSAISADDVFFYVYGSLHAPEYREKFAGELRKSLARLPMHDAFWDFTRAGRELADLHLNYETATPFELDEKVTAPAHPAADHLYRVKKMRFAKGNDRSTIVYNDNLTLSGIPTAAYDYLVNGRSAVEWVMDRYQVRIDKPSGVTNDANAYSSDPRYIVDLLGRVITVSLRTLEISGSLPPEHPDTPTAPPIAAHELRE